MINLPSRATTTHSAHFSTEVRLITQNVVVCRVIVGRKSQIVQLQQGPAVHISTTTAPNQVHSGLIKLEYAQEAFQ